MLVLFYNTSLFCSEFFAPDLRWNWKLPNPRGPSYLTEGIREHLFRVQLLGPSTPSILWSPCMIKYYKKRFIVAFSQEDIFSKLSEMLNETSSIRWVKYERFTPRACRKFVVSKLTTATSSSWNRRNCQKFSANARLFRTCVWHMKFPPHPVEFLVHMGTTQHTNRDVHL